MVSEEQSFITEQTRVHVTSETDLGNLSPNLWSCQGVFQSHYVEDRVTAFCGIHHLIVPLHLNILYKLLGRRNLILDSADRYKAELKRGNDICLSYRCSVSVRISDMANTAGKGSVLSCLKL